nr:YqiA/YcfP family alpha/beta fold hydrolase [Atopomonas sediminilitoris]
MLIYLHGFNSSPQSLKVRLLADALAGLGLAERLYAPQLPHSPAQALALLEQRAASEALPPVLIGSSLGGFYATALAQRHGWKALLINPAVRPSRWVADYLGEQRNYHSGETWQLTQDFVDQIQQLECPAPCAPERYQVWLQTQDETLDYRDAVSYYRGCALRVEPGGEHGFQGFAAHIPALLAFAGWPAEYWQDSAQPQQLRTR